MKSISKAKGTTGNANRQRGVAERTADQARGGGVGVGVVQSSPSSSSSSATNPQWDAEQPTLTSVNSFISRGFEQFSSRTLFFKQDLSCGGWGGEVKWQEKN